LRKVEEPFVFIFNQIEELEISLYRILSHKHFNKNNEGTKESIN